MSDGEIYVERHEKAEYGSRSFIERFIFLLMTYVIIYCLSSVFPSMQPMSMWTVSNVPLGVLCIASCTALGISRTIINRNMIDTIPGQMQISNIIADGFSVSAKYAVLEELYYRWLMFSCLISVVSLLDVYFLCRPFIIGMCVLYVSVRFAEAHLYQGVRGAVSALLISFVLFFVTLKCGIIFAMLVHFFYNLSLFLTSAVLLSRFRKFS